MVHRKARQGYGLAPVRCHDEKDDGRLSELQSAIDGAALWTEDGAPSINGLALENLSKDHFKTQHVLRRLSRRYNPIFLEMMIDHPPMTLELLNDFDGLTAWIKDFMPQLSAHGELHKVEYQLTAEPATEMDSKGKFQIRLQQREHGTLSSKVFDAEFFESKDFGQIASFGLSLQGLLTSSSAIQRGEKKQSVSSFKEAIEWLFGEAKRGQNIQRYKGLGEMNPEQLWETTMNAEARRLLQVTVRDAITADQVFTTLMGDEVEPRRNYIETHAKDVKHLDV